MINGMVKMRKRSGAGLLLALFVVLLGGGIVAMMYGFTNSFFSAAVEQRKEYRDDILASSYIERAKGWIIATNLDGRDEALKGLKRKDVSDVETDLKIPDSGDLNISETVDGRRVEVAVYDANYESLSHSFNQYDKLPPSLAYSGGGVATGGLGGNEAGGPDYISPQNEKLAGDTKKFGAYVIRVKIFDAVTNNLIRETETGFFQVIP